ncbi:ClpP/crotonase [Fomitiporia mediterranea MF3/22]|uniref:ClpP/crotonase n=1 Tax=Fomitiporia mediterranea (strain MF3/22) TaxID=694068 RepID=UPI000440962A|nr:ClpP/crotonase [Fomitiporia mediterranea MF3/22]EJC99128.1 ClpP/crotonase [Fomitiporia mediterranea MF3/22]
MSSNKPVMTLAFEPPLPTTSNELIVAFPAEHVMQLTLNRPAARNAMSTTLEEDIGRTLAWFDAQPSLWVAIITGNGRVFCAGVDLKAWEKETSDSDVKTNRHSPEGIVALTHGFGGLLRRTASCKPLIAAVVGGAFGGGVEMLLNCDLVIAADDATFGLPEVKVGVVPAAGGIPRLVATAGRRLASEMMLFGRTVTVQEAYSRFGITKRGIILAWQHGDVDEAMVKHALSAESVRHYAGENIKEGLKAFVEKCKPKWSNPAKL